MSEGKKIMLQILGMFLFILYIGTFELTRGKYSDLSFWRFFILHLASYMFTVFIVGGIIAGAIISEKKPSQT